MPLRFMDYTHRVWVNHLLEHPDEVQLPPVISIVVHHGALGWTAPRSLHEMVTDLVALPGAADHVPELRIALLDLTFATDEDLTGWTTSPVTQVAFWLLRDGRDIEALLGGLQSFATALARVVTRHPDEAMLFMSYILRVAGERSAHEVRRIVLQHVPNAEEPMASAAEQLIEEGLQRGLRQGVAQGLVEGRAALHDALHTLLVQRFGTVDPVSEARLHDADLAELKRLTGRVLGAPSLADVFASS